MSRLDNKSFSTRAVHAGERLPASRSASVVTPIHPSVGFLSENMETMDAVFAGELDGYVYARYSSPTVSAFEAAVANLEGAEAAQAFSSGMAAIHATLLAAGAASGSHVVAAMDVYGATYTLLQTLLRSLGVQSHWVDVTNLAQVETALAEHHPVALLAETVSNPLLKVANVGDLAGLARRYDAQLVIDNTFASPYLFNPLAHGADYVIHSATKYIGGHGDVLAGVVATSQANRIKLYEINKLAGAALGPFEAWLALRGVKTLPLRMRQQCQNAVEIAGWLQAQESVARVHYPGLPEHPQHKLAQGMFQGKGYGGVLSFEIAGGDQARVFRFINALQLIQSATTLGDLYTLVLHPATASHRSLSPAEREKVGIPDGLVRLSAGIEDAEDLIADLEQALRRALE